jgi:hypothetical protein
VCLSNVRMSGGVRIMFLRDKNGHPVGCIAIEKSSLISINYQVSVNNPVDKFDRKLARQLAIGRLYENPITIMVTKEDLANTRSITHVVMDNMSLTDRVPERARRAAKRWLNVKVPERNAYVSSCKDISDEKLRELMNEGSKLREKTSKLFAEIAELCE